MENVEKKVEERKLLSRLRKMFVSLDSNYLFIYFAVDDNPISWAGSDRDYTYDELLNRVFDIILEKNPDMAAGRKPKFVMRPPQVLRVGTKKTSFANFTEICKTLHRQPKHLLDFLLAELGTSGSVDGNSQLIIKGRFQPKQIENVLRRYDN
jgi:translation initiation factor 2 subunit 2